MENPDWTEDTKTIQKAIDEYNSQLARGIVGYSMPKIIETRVIKPLRNKIEELEEKIRQLEANKL